MLAGKKIILGVTGSIAAIKSPIVARELMRHGATVVPVLTQSALEFTTATALSALTRQSAVTDIFSKEKAGACDAGTWHIHLGRSADAMLIAPCSASTIGLLAHGIYDNAVTLLASSLPQNTPLVLAPAMDEEMWSQAAVQDNLALLRSRGVLILDPVSGPLASGLVGHGRMEEPAELVLRFAELIRPTGALSGKSVLITGGPTYEPIDAVRFIGNRSSGKMAVALAETALMLGATVKLVMGPSAEVTSRGIDRTDVETAEEMRDAVLARLDTAEVIVMNAAVADFRPAMIADSKLKKREIKDLSIALVPTKDILAEIAERRSPKQFVVGFALEKGNNSAGYAREKLTEKLLDMIVLNDLNDAGAGFSHDTNKVTMYLPTGEEISTPLVSKIECAERIFAQIEAQLRKI
jgi:phosphopantothenoylcysteine decarboxylase/phosphopantothenate--cysteine ligase